MKTARLLKVNAAAASFAAVSAMILIAGQAATGSGSIDASLPPPKPADAPASVSAGELTSPAVQAPSPEPAQAPEPPPPEPKPAPEPSTEPTPPPPEPEPKPAQPEPKPEVESPHGAEPAAEPGVEAPPDAAPALRPPMASNIDDTDTEGAQGQDGSAPALVPLPDLAPLDGERGQLGDISAQAQAPGPGGEYAIPPLPCQLTNAGLVCAGAENCVITSGGALCTENGIPCVVTSAGSKCVAGCSITSAGLVCPPGCTLTSAGIRCPNFGAVAGSLSDVLEQTRRLKPTRELKAPRSETARAGPRESGPRLGELPFTGAPLLWPVVVGCVLVAAGGLLRRTCARER